MDSSGKEEKVEDFILKPEKLMETQKLRAASALSLREAFKQTKNAESLVFTKLGGGTPNQTFFLGIK